MTPAVRERGVPARELHAVAFSRDERLWYERSPYVASMRNKQFGAVCHATAARPETTSSLPWTRVTSMSGKASSWDPGCFVR